MTFKSIYSFIILLLFMQSNTLAQSTILALGDSYTIGESVEVNERWPVQLANQLNNSGVKVKNPRIIATTGWTTDELQTAIKLEDIDDTYDLVTLLIGVNNQYRGYPFKQFKNEYEDLLDYAIAKAGGNAGKVIVVSIPDWGATPFAKDRDSKQIRKEIDKYNKRKKKEALKKGAYFVYITDISRQAPDNKKLVANDGLHPSGEMYSHWVDRIFPLAQTIIEDGK